MDSLDAVAPVHAHSVVSRRRRGTTVARRWRRLLRLGFGTALLLAWWLFFAPVALGGGTTFTIVQGRSMEPTLYDGDLVLTRQRAEYAVGDLVVYPIATNKAVIHRIIDGSVADGWITQGDNNDRPDAWVVPNDGILGEYWFMIPRVGVGLEWLREHPLPFAAVVGSVVIAVNVIGRRRRLHPTLAAAVATGRRAPRLAGRPPEQVAMLFIACASGVVTFVGLTLLVAAGLVFSVVAAAIAVLLVASLTTVAVLMRRLADGHGVAEPLASQYVLGARCWDVDELPEVPDVVEATGPHALRDLIEQHRTCVLRHLGTDGSVSYLTIDRDGVAHRWHPTP